MIRLAIFDCDGTLIDGQASICEAMEQAFAEFALPLPERNQVRRAVGLSLPQAVRQLLPASADEEHHAIVEAYKRHFRAAREAGALQQPLIPGIAALLDALRQGGWLLGVATGMSSRGLGHLLATHRLTDHFVTLQTADDHPSKPHPSMLEAALAEAGVAHPEAVMIGDTAFDMAMAHTAGVRAIGVDWGYHEPHELVTAGAEYVAKTVPQLQEYLIR